MRFDCISQEAWAEFNKKFPQATAFLLQSSLEGELRILQGRNNLNEWESRRLASLEKLLAPCDRCGGTGKNTRELPIVTLEDGKTYYIDIPLRQLRNVEDRCDIIDLPDEVIKEIQKP